MALQIERLKIPGLLVIRQEKFTDERGFFVEKYKMSEFEAIGIPAFVQDNYSVSKRGVIRGLHFQKEPFAQGKLVSAVEGSVWDVAVDTRDGSPTFGQWEGVELSEENNLSFYIPPGFAHGFSVLSAIARVLYKCTAEYSQINEGGIRFDDPGLNIDWKITKPIVSQKDLKWPTLNAKK